MNEACIAGMTSGDSSFPDVRELALQLEIVNGYRTALCKLVAKLSIYSENLEPMQTKNHWKNHPKNQHAHSTPLIVWCI